MELPKDYIESLKEIKGLNIEKLVASYQNNPKIGIRFNLIKFDNKCENIEKILKKYVNFSEFSPILWCKTGFYYSGKEKLGKNILHEIGLYYMQEPSAMAPVNFLDVKENDFVLDLCASPGGKTTQIAEKLKSGFLISNEIVPSRAKVLAENVQRLGFDNIAVVNHSPKELEKLFFESFDKVLVDAPCSGEGMFRKNPESINEWTKNSPISCAERQKQIVDSAYKMLKPNGIMIYSTCTFSLEEDECVIKYLLDNYNDLELLDIEKNDYNFDNGEQIDGDVRLKKCARLYPYKIEGEGHFIAKLHKKSIKNNEISSKIKKNSSFNKKNVVVFEKWCNENLNVKFDNYCSIGDSLYANCKINIDKLKIVSVGLYLGEVRKDIFIPSWHLAHHLKKENAKLTEEISEEDAKKYIAGEEINTDIKTGWVLLTYKNLPLAFGKAVNGKIKNHYPKNIRKKL